MRNIPKLPEPPILASKKDEWNNAVKINPSGHNKNKYRHPDIKATLCSETNDKCVYCESKIGHNCPGDIEHKIPKSRRPDLIFEWDNLTIACNECNRRKLGYYEPSCMFLDPNTDDVENMLQHLGPFIYNLPGNKRSEVTIRILELDKLDGRIELIARKMEKLEEIKHLVERIVSEPNQIVKTFLIKDLSEKHDIVSEYSGMVKSYVDLLPTGWHSN